MTWREYQAKCVDDSVNGKSTLTFEQAIRESLTSFPGPQKREDICSMIASRTGVSMADAMCNISYILSAMKKRGEVYSPLRGYWALNKTIERKQ